MLLIKRRIQNFAFGVCFVCWYHSFSVNKQQQNCTYYEAFFYLFFLVKSTSNSILSSLLCFVTRKINGGVIWVFFTSQFPFLIVKWEMEKDCTYETSGCDSLRLGTTPYWPKTSFLAWISMWNYSSVHIMHLFIYLESELSANRITISYSLLPIKA